MKDWGDELLLKYQKRVNMACDAFEGASEIVNRLEAADGAYLWFLWSPGSLFRSRDRRGQYAPIK